MKKIFQRLKKELKVFIYNQGKYATLTNSKLQRNTNYRYIATQWNTLRKKTNNEHKQTHTK